MAGGYQVVIIHGNVGNDIDLTYAKSGIAIGKFSVATSKKMNDGSDKTSWHRCVAFGKTAETMAQWVKKGSGILVEGELSYGQYEKDGVTHYTTEVIVNRFTFTTATTKKDGQGSRPQQQYSTSEYHGHQHQQNGTHQQNNGYKQQSAQELGMNDYFDTPIKDDDIPF